MGDLIIPEVVETAMVPTTPAMLLNIAIKNGADLDRLEKLMELQTRWEERQSHKSYNMAMANFKANLPTVVKDKTNSQYKSKYASEDALLNTINPELSKYGLSATYDFKQDGDRITVICYMTHAEGHRESVSLSGAPDSSGSKNPLQQIKSTTTYLKKATFEAITGIASSDNADDDDGNGAGGVKYVSEEQIASINAKINEKSVDSNAFLTYMAAPSIGKIKEVDFNKALKALNAAKGKQSPVYITAQQKKMLEAVIGKLNLDRELVKEYFWLHKQCDEENGVPTLNKLHVAGFQNTVEKEESFMKDFSSWLAKRG